MSTTTGTPASAGAIVNRGWQVTFAGMGINLALGILYTWSVISKAIPADWGWTEADKSLPYSIACLVFSLIDGAGRTDAGPDRPASRGHRRRPAGGGRA